MSDEIIKAIRAFESEGAVREHEESENCWCYPTLDYVDPYTGVKVWTHKGPDELNN